MIMIIIIIITIITTTTTLIIRLVTRRLPTTLIIRLVTPIANNNRQFKAQGTKWGNREDKQKYNAQ